MGGFGLGLRRATFRLLHCSICLWASVDRYQKVFHQKQSVDSRALEIERTTLQCRALDIVVAALQPTQCAALWRKTGSTEENINSIVGNNLQFGLCLIRKSIDRMHLLHLRSVESSTHVYSNFDLIDNIII